ncbi:MAG: TatD family hydrolase [Verrucomicrobia bacterium]|nr:TatD family hydrolase [Prolixibacteraceae bacterium]
MHYIDLHTHQIKESSAFQLLNVFAQDLPLAVDANHYSVGLHPWHLEKVNIEECMGWMEQAMDQKNVLAIGECGLDRSVASDLSLQEKYFSLQVALAQRHSKPLIIHCVRAFPELVKLKKELKSTVPWIIHGYSGNEETTRALIKHDFYFSVGEGMLIHPTKSNVLSLIPSDHLFFETDDRAISISSIYLLASKLLNTEQQTLQAIIYENFKRLFGEQNG